MTNIHCKLICRSSAEHLDQLYAGYGVLSQQGAINIEIVKGDQFIRRHILTVILNESLVLTYDTEDHDMVFPEELARSDLYFKRSYSATAIQGQPDHRHKIFPMGLNYPVYGAGDRRLLRHLWSLVNDRSISTTTGLLRIIRLNSRFQGLLPVTFRQGRFDMKAFEGSPKRSGDPRILFLARTWDPLTLKKYPELRAERDQINLMRAECIRKLRKEFSGTFFGGFAPTPYAQKYFKDCIVDGSIIQKRNYLKLLRDSDIAIATKGLRGSNGFKLAEYVAGAKAIISEPLVYQLPGDFGVGRNYVEFTTADDCVAAARKLIDDPNERYRVMENNYTYYNAYLRPDKLVWNTIQIALKMGKQQRQ